MLAPLLQPSLVSNLSSKKINVFVSQNPVPVVYHYQALYSLLFCWILFPIIMLNIDPQPYHNWMLHPRLRGEQPGMATPRARLEVGSQLMIALGHLLLVAIHSTSIAWYSGPVIHDHMNVGTTCLNHGSTLYHSHDQ